MAAILDLALASANQRVAFHSLHLVTSWLTAIGRACICVICDVMRSSGSNHKNTGSELPKYVIQDVNVLLQGMENPPY